VPKQLHEIKRFQSGTITTPSDTDIPEDAANSSLNIDAMSEDGMLKGVKNDTIVPVASSYGVSSTASSTYNNGVTAIEVEDGSSFASSGYITFIDNVGDVQVLKYAKTDLSNDDNWTINGGWRNTGNLAVDTTVYQMTTSDIKADKFSKINDSGTHKGVIFDDTDNKFKKIDNIHANRPVSSNLSSTAETHSALPSMINNNKELHVGMGDGANDEPKWIGMIPHGQYGGSAPATMQLTDAKLLSPNSIPDFYKPVSDGTYIYGFEYGSSVIWKLKISDFSITKRKLVVKDNAVPASFTAICMGSDGHLWVIDTSSISYKVVEGAYKDLDGTTITHPLRLGTWMRIDKDSLEILKSGSLMYTQSASATILPYWPLTADVTDNADANNHWIVTDILEKGSYLWISGAVADGGGNSNLATVVKGYNYLFTKPTSDFNLSGSVTLNGDRGATAPYDTVGYGIVTNNGSDTRGAFSLTGASNNTPVYVKIPKINLVEISGTNDVVGILMDIYTDKNAQGIDRGGDGLYNGSSNVNIGGIIVLTDIAMRTQNNANDGYVPSVSATYKGGIAYLTESSSYVTYDGYIKGVASAEGKLLISVQNTSTTTSSDLKYSSQPTNISGNSNSSIAELSSASTTYDINEGRPYLKDNGSNVDIHLFAGAGNGRWMSSTNTASSIGADIFTVRMQSELALNLTNTGASSSHVNDKKYYYKCAYVYDGYQESPLGDFTSITSDGSAIDIELIIRTTTVLSKRISGIAIYMAEGANTSIVPEGFYRYVDTINLNNTFVEINEDLTGNPDWGTYRRKIYNHNGVVGASYDARTGISEILEDTIVNYGLSTDLNNQLFVAQCYHLELDDASNYLFKSRPYNYDQFNYINDFLILPIYPTAISSFNNRIYVFDKNNILRIEPNSMYVESSMNGIGCLGQDSVLSTEYGMCFADKHGIYLHDGQRANNISTAILRGDANYSWENIDFSYVPKIAFHNYNKSFLITFKTGLGTYFTWEYNLVKRRWDRQRLFKVNGLSQVTAEPKDFILGENGEIIWNINGYFYDINSDKSNRKSWDWASKQITINRDTQDKSFTNFYLTGSPSGSLGTNISVNLDEGNRLEVVNDGANGYTNFILDSKKGKKMQWVLSSQTGTVDALGVAYRLLKNSSG
tara:strand:+ start:4651 stop:8097 length:3447 start_codon:yes stop_codon:yes gene_type:complete